MSLKEYARKRTFTQTPEPAPKAPEVTPAGNFYCVQRHHATRLHYDFRLEVNGALVSWAVPKGPTLSPAEKRLAMHVEDHPLDYGNFEGTIPAGNYGAGSVMLWDRGTFETLGDLPAQAQLDRGDFKFRLHGEKLKGEFAIVRMKNRGKGNEWLLLKKKDAFADPEYDAEQHDRSVLTGRTQEEIARGMAAVESAAGSKHSYPKGAVKAPMPENITPMKGTLAASPPRGDGWLYEIKWDGVRAICMIANGAVRMVSRSGKSCERQYPELSVLPHFVDAREAVLDGEICVLDERGRPRFNLIQNRIMVSDPASIAALARSKPATLFLFDLLYLDGHDLRAIPLVERKKLLKAVVRPGGAIRISECFEEGEHLLEAAREQELEGVIAKRVDSRYEARRTNTWLKIKTVRHNECVICGYTQGERDYFGALVLGVSENNSLVWAGNVGTGFDNARMAEIHRRLQPLVTAKSPFKKQHKLLKGVTWVRPELVCTVKYIEWTPDGRLRAPVFIGLRPDVDPKEAVREWASQPEEPGEPSVAPAPGTPLLPETQAQVILDIEGRQLKFTNLNKIFYPREGHTKRDLINYYNAVSALILPHLRDRPLSLKRYPNGIHADFFFQKRSAESFPEWLRTEPIYSEHNKAPINYAVCNDRASLLYLANLGCIDQNPWMSRVGSLDSPDYILIDLDPQECSYDRIVEAALLVREKLDRIGLTGYPKTTGGDGMHIYIPLEPGYTYEQARIFAEILGMLVSGQRPDLFTTPRSVAKRDKGKVYFDYLQIGEGKTISAPYVLRAYDGAPVSTPLEWKEVKQGLAPGQFHIGNAVERFERVGDLFEGVLKKRQRLEKPLEKLEPLLRGTGN
ncbi:MAG TPA: DNA ligase D [Bryobacteraceae bacterium]|nr:DNA ligase D [Bryobacteraceae bacterium]